MHVVDARTGGVWSEQVTQRLSGAGDFDGRDAHREARARLVLLLADAAKEPRDGRRYETGVGRRVAPAHHRRRLACKSNRNSINSSLPFNSMARRAGSSTAVYDRIPVELTRL